MRRPHAVHAQCKNLLDNGGSFFNSLSATTTLGCGSWGNNSISENLSWRHLFNVSRVAKVRPGSTMPTDEEIWG